MKRFPLIYVIILCSLPLTHCRTEKYYDKFLGNWEQVKYVGEYEYNSPLVKRIQIERRGDLMIAAVENQEEVGPNLYFFYICEKKKDHLELQPSKYYELRDQSYVKAITAPVEIHFDKEREYLYLLNTIFVRSSQPVYNYQNGKIHIMKPL